MSLRRKLSREQGLLKFSGKSGSLCFSLLVRKADT